MYLSELGSNGSYAIVYGDVARQKSPLQILNLYPAAEKQQALGLGTFRRERQQFGERRADRVGPSA